MSEAIEMDGFRFGEKAKHKNTGIVGNVTCLAWWESGYKSVTIRWVRSDGGLSSESFEPNQLEKIG